MKKCKNNHKWELQEEWQYKVIDDFDTPEINFFVVCSKCQEYGTMNYVFSNVKDSNENIIES